MNPSPDSQKTSPTTHKIPDESSNKVILMILKNSILTIVITAVVLYLIGF
jgi:hypothetical protein